MQVVFVHRLFVGRTRMLLYLLIYPGHIPDNIRIDTWQLGMCAHNAPGDDAANKPTILFARIGT